MSTLPAHHSPCQIFVDGCWLRSVHRESPNGCEKCHSGYQTQGQNSSLLALKSQKRPTFFYLFIEFQQGLQQWLALFLHQSINSKFPIVYAVFQASSSISTHLLSRQQFYSSPTKLRAYSPDQDTKSPSKCPKAELRYLITKGWGCKCLPFFAKAITDYARSLSLRHISKAFNFNTIMEFSLP